MKFNFVFLFLSVSALLNTSSALGVDSPSDKIYNPILTCETPRGKLRKYAIGWLEENQEKNWHLYYQDKESKDQWIVLTMFRAQPEVAKDAFKLDYSSFVGGAAIEIEYNKNGVSLYIDVNYELEVNADANLDPEIERANTEKTLKDLNCKLNNP